MSAPTADTATVAKPPTHAVAIMAGVGVVTGLISSLPSPLPNLRLEDPDILINAPGVPLHAGIAFGAGLAIIMWRWVRRNARKCLLTAALTLAGWLVAVNAANDTMSWVVGSELFGTVEGAKASRETLGWVLAGLIGGGIGAGFTAFGAGAAARTIRRPQGWIPIAATGTLFGLLLYPAALLDVVALLYVPWQAAVAAAIAYGLTRAQPN